MKKIINLGMHPFADTFISDKHIGHTEPVYPLECVLHEDTGHIELAYTTKAEERYNLYDYSYTSANSSFSRNYWDEYAKHVSKKLNLNTSKIFEIGSNDGYLSKQFQNLGHNVIGIDSSKYMSNIANQLGIETYCGIFNYSTSLDIKNKFGKSDLVIANNVFNHSNNPIDFAKGVNELLNESGVFVFEVPYWYNTIIDKRFDQIYHEHVSYFTVKSCCELLKKVGLQVFDVEIVDYHGGSIRVYSSINPEQINARIYDYIKIEEDAGLFKESTYVEFMKYLKIRRAKFLEKLYAISKKNVPIVAVGAAAKGNTFLNFYNLDNTVIDYVTDASKHKIGKYTPLTRIPIQTDEFVFKKYKEVYVIILSWNISSILKEKLNKLNKNVADTNLELHSDDRGYIVDLFYNDNINHVAKIISVPNSIRGNHYHKETTQHMLITKGYLEYWYKPVDSNEPAKMVLAEEGDIISTGPYEIHALKIGPFGNEFIVFSQGLRGGKDYEQDTFRVDNIIGNI